MGLLIRLGLFDDHDIVRAGFRYILGQHSDIDIVAEGATGREALAAIRGPQAIDVCLVDLSLPDLSGMDVLRQAKASRPEVAVLIPQRVFGGAVRAERAEGRGQRPS